MNDIKNLCLSIECALDRGERGVSSTNFVVVEAQQRSTRKLNFYIEINDSVRREDATPYIYDQLHDDSNNGDD